jgi:hypothetical protein
VTKKAKKRAPYNLPEKPCDEVGQHRAHFSSLATWCFGVRQSQKRSGSDPPPEDAS